MKVGIEKLVEVASRLTLLLALSQQHRSTGKVSDGAECIGCTFDEARRCFCISRRNQANQQGASIDAVLEQLLANLLDLPGTGHGGGDSAAGQKNRLRNADANRIGSSSQQQDDMRVGHSNCCLERDLPRTKL